METVCKIENLVKTYHKRTVLDNFRLRIQEGDIYGLLGKNGAGKTTLMRVLMGLSRAEKGRIEILGASNPQTLSAMRKRMSAVIENPAFYPYMTAYENLKMHQCLVYGHMDKQKAVSALAKVGLLKDADKKVRNYSLGMKQRLGIARALSCEAQIIVLDEPTNGLDLEGMRLLKELILELNQSQKVTFLISSHHIAELEQIATVFGILNNGAIVYEKQASKMRSEVQQSGLTMEDFVWNWMK